MCSRSVFRNLALFLPAFGPAFGLLSGMGSALADPQATPLTLEEALKQAEEQSPALRQARASEDAASWTAVDALSGNLPRIALSGQHLFAVKYQVLDFNLNGVASLFPFISPGTSFTLGAYWTVFDGLKTPNAYQAARDTSEATRLERQRAEFTLREQVELLYFEALGAQLLADVADQNVKTLENHLQETQALLRHGTITRFDLLRVQVQLEEAIPERTTALDDVVIARQKLATAMGTPDSSRPLSGKLPPPEMAAVSPNLTLNTDTRDDLKALALRADAADASRAAAQNSWYPQVTLVAEQQWYNNTNLNVFDAYRDAYDVGLNFTWTLFDLGSTVAKPHVAAATQEKAEAEADAARIAAPEEFETWKRRYGYNVAFYQARRRAVDAALESVRLARIGYNAGTRTNTDVLDAELDLFRARAGVVRAQLGAGEALANLELALGRKLQNGQ